MRESHEQQFHTLLRDAVKALTSPPPTAGAPAVPKAAIETLRWEVPKDPTFGDFSSPIAFKLASSQRCPPQDVAEQLVERFRQAATQAGLDSLIDHLEVKRGFVNVFLSSHALANVVATILRERTRYGTGRLGEGKAVLIEFVSANPTGPLSVAHGRQAAVGDALARLLTAQGYRVVREYLVNDEGHQIDLLGRSIQIRYAEEFGQQIPFPEDGYQGAYVADIARAFRHRHGARYRDRLTEETLPEFVRFGTSWVLREIRRDFRLFQLRFDRWVSQRWLGTSGRIEQSLEALRRHGALYEQDQAVWFASTRFGDDKDRVVKKQSGELTYFAPDIAYHAWKFKRGFDLLVNLWGPDHHGYIPRVKAAVTALKLPADQLIIRIVQLVTLSRQGKPVPMSKRQGEFVTFREILEEVGVDATRFFYLMRTMDSHLDFDLDLAKSKAQENPVYYVQYAHARIWSILGYAKRQVAWWKKRPRVNLLRLAEPEERLLIRQLFQFPQVVAMCAQALEPHGVTMYLQKVAETFHVFYSKHRVITEDIELSQARLALVRATRDVLRNGLALLGVTASRRM